MLLLLLSKLLSVAITFCAPGITHVKCLKKCCMMHQTQYYWFLLHGQTIPRVDITDQSRCIDKGFVQYMGFDFPSKICLFVVFNYNTHDHIQVSNNKNLMLATPLDEGSDHCTFYL